MLHDTGFINVIVGEPVDTFAGASGEANARAYEVYGYAFLAQRLETRGGVVRPSEGSEFGVRVGRGRV
jgi:hypothetical protein